MCSKWRGPPLQVVEVQQCDCPERLSLFSSILFCSTARSFLGICRRPRIHRSTPKNCWSLTTKVYSVEPCNLFWGVPIPDMDDISHQEKFRERGCMKCVSGGHEKWCKRYSVQPSKFFYHQIHKSLKFRAACKWKSFSWFSHWLTLNLLADRANWVMWLMYFVKLRAAVGFWAMRQAMKIQSARAKWKALWKHPFSDLK